MINRIFTRPVFNSGSLRFDCQLAVCANRLLLFGNEIDEKLAQLEQKYAGGANAFLDFKPTFDARSYSKDYKPVEPNTPPVEEGFGLEMEQEIDVRWI